MRAPASLGLGTELMALIERIVDERVDRKLAELGVAVEHYTTRNPPPGVSTRAFSFWCRDNRVDDAERDGSGWRCSRAAWERARARGPKARPQRGTRGKFVSQFAANDLLGLDPDALLRQARLRPTGGR